LARTGLPPRCNRLLEAPNRSLRANGRHRNPSVRTAAERSNHVLPQCRGADSGVRRMLCQSGFRRRCVLRRISKMIWRSARDEKAEAIVLLNVSTSTSTCAHLTCAGDYAARISAALLCADSPQWPRRGHGALGHTGPGMTPRTSRTDHTHVHSVRCVRIWATHRVGLSDSWTTNRCATWTTIICRSSANSSDFVPCPRSLLRPVCC